MSSDDSDTANYPPAVERLRKGLVDVDIDDRKRKSQSNDDTSKLEHVSRRLRQLLHAQAPMSATTAALNLLSQGPEAINEEFTKRFPGGHSQPGNLNPDGTPITDELTWVKTMLLHTQDRMVAAWEEIESIRAKSEEMVAKSEMVISRAKGWKIERKYKGSFDVLLGHTEGTKGGLEELGKVGEAKVVEKNEGD